MACQALNQLFYLIHKSNEEMEAQRDEVFWPRPPGSGVAAPRSNQAGGSGCRDWASCCLGASCLLKANYLKCRQLQKRVHVNRHKTQDWNSEEALRAAEARQNEPSVGSGLQIHMKGAS